MMEQLLPSKSLHDLQLEDGDILVLQQRLPPVSEGCGCVCVCVAVCFV